MTRLLAGGDIQEAVQRLKNSELVALPTETVYGLGARADDPRAVQRIFEAKGRPANHPLIVHISDVAQFEEWACDIPESVYRLAAAFCPGPLTFILPLKASRDRTVTGGQSFVGLRIPNHPLTLEVLRQSGLGIAAPSANRFGRISPTSAMDVLAELQGKIDAVLDGGVCQVGIESTIIKVESGHISLLRPGFINLADIEAVAQQSVTIPEHIQIRVSGNLDSHYAPIKPAYRLTVAQLDEKIIKQWNAGDWVLSYSHSGVNEILAVAQAQCGIQIKQLPCAVDAYAQGLYAALREADEYPNIKRIWVIEPEDTAEWMAVRDRIYRATRSYVFC